MVFGSCQNINLLMTNAIITKGVETRTSMAPEDLTQEKFNAVALFLRDHAV